MIKATVIEIKRDLASRAISPVIVDHGTFVGEGMQISVLRGVRNLGEVTK